MPLCPLADVQVSVVCFRLANVETSVQMRGKDISIAAQVDHLLPWEHGNINLDQFQAKFSSGES